MDCASASAMPSARGLHDFPATIGPDLMSLFAADIEASFSALIHERNQAQAKASALCAAASSREEALKALEAEAQRLRAANSAFEESAKVCMM